MRNISVKLFLIWTSNAGDVVIRHFSPSSGVDVVLQHFLSSALAAPLWENATV